MRNPLHRHSYAACRPENNSKFFFFNTNTEAKQHIKSCSENRTERSIRWQSFTWTALVAIGIDGGFAVSINKR